jgi:two-component system sensor histidine kinase ArlS
MNKKTFIKPLFEFASESFIALFKIIFTLIPKGIFYLYKSVNKRLRFSITFKTTVIYTFIISTILFILSTILISLFSFFIYNHSKTSINNLSIIIESYLTDDIASKDSILKKYSELENLKINIFDANKKLLYSTDTDNIETTMKDEANNSLVHLSDGMHFQMNKKVTIVDKSFYINYNKLLISESNFFIILIIVLTTYSIIALTIAIRIGSRTIKKMLIPIYHMTAIAKSISVKDLDKRLDVIDSHDELKDLAETFNDMLNRIEAAYEQQNRFVSDASHELRTPISVVQGYANLLSRWGKEDKAVLDESVIAIKNEAENMKNLVEKLLFLARADKNTQKLEKENFYVNELIEEIIKDTKLIANNHNILNFKNDTAILCADKNLIKQALRIFIDNSIKYTPTGGTITINSYLNADLITITIEDTGIGISEEDLPFIFDRFYRCDKARSRQSGGTGLGLSIAKWIISSHAGTTEVQSTLNIGTKIIISIPRQHND